MLTDHIKPYIDNFGNIKHSSDTNIRIMPKYRYKGILQFTQVHSAFIEDALQIHTLASMKVLLALISLNASILNTENKVIVTQKQLAVLIKSSQCEVSKALKNLKELNLLISYSRGEVTLNPNYIWKGNLNIREEKLFELRKTETKEQTI